MAAMGEHSSAPANYGASANTVLAVYIVLTAATVIVCTNPLKLTRTSPRAEDYLCYLAFTVNLGLLISGLLLTSFGALDLSHLAMQGQRKKDSLEEGYIALTMFYILAVTLIKLSIMLLYRRIFTVPSTWFYWCWWILLIFVIFWAVACVVLLALQAADQMPKDGFSRPGSSTTAIIDAISDLLLLILPATMASRAELRARQKFAVALIFGFGVIASTACFIRRTIPFIDHDHKFNEAFLRYLDIVLIATESSTGFMCACLPRMEPIVVHCKQWLRRSRGVNIEHQSLPIENAPTEGTEKDCDRIITRTYDYEVHLTPMSKFTETLPSLGNGYVMDGHDFWRSIGLYETRAHCESNAQRKQNYSFMAK